MPCQDSPRFRPDVRRLHKFVQTGGSGAKFGPITPCPGTNGRFSPGSLRPGNRYVPESGMVEDMMCRHPGGPIPRPAIRR